MPEALYLLGLAVILFFCGRTQKVRWCKFGYYSSAAFMMILTTALFISEYIVHLATASIILAIGAVMIWPRKKAHQNKDALHTKTRLNGSYTSYDVQE